MDKEVFQAAIEAASRVRLLAYAPYSHFLVGACLIDASGLLHVGCNVENASYGLTMCAERAAVMAATASGKRDVHVCVIVTDSSEPTAPCGACRQVLYECNPSMLVISRTLSGVECSWTLSELLPSAFSNHALDTDT